MIDENMTIKEVAQEYKITSKTVYEWIKRGLPMFKIGRMTRIKRSDLIKFISKGDAMTEEEMEMEKGLDRFIEKTNKEIDIAIDGLVKEGLMDYEIYKIYNDKYPDNFCNFVELVTDKLDNLNREELLPGLIIKSISECKSEEDLDKLFNEILKSFDSSFFDCYGLMDYAEEKDFDLKELKE